ncbi:hypothetical protein [Saccharicrinis aurantiacus]|uniref:hypothetical protein n=1 Tax=Saccharicrinis aurantiacus TaxID=1849719 RepID=UPI0011153198|nr:hypothetical protein [Saccharicrinis aurantiacus]
MRYILIITLMFIWACETEKDYYQINEDKLNQIIRFSEVIIDNDSIADHYSKSIIKVKTDPNTTVNQVTFKRNFGLFENGFDTIATTINTIGEAHLFLLHPDSPSKVLLTAMVANYSIDTVIQFTTSYAEDFILKADPYSTDTLGQITLRAELFKENGVITQGQKVRFFFDPNAPLLEYPDLPAYAITENNAASVTLTNPYHLQNKYQIVARVPISNADSIDKQILIEIK